MKENNGHIHSPIAPESVWNQVGHLIQAVLSDRTLENPDLSPIPEDAAAVPGGHQARFFSAVRRWAGIPRRVPVPTLVEKWTLEQRRPNWLARAWKTWNQVAAEIRDAGNEFRVLGDSLEAIFTRMSQQLVPAPAYRDATAVREYVYKPRRRAIEPAALPVFSPLFCTSVEPDAKPYTITGLTPGQTYRFSLVSVLDNRIHQDRSLQSNTEGKLELDLANWLHLLLEKQGRPADFAWLLHEIKEAESPGDPWASGLVWREPGSSHQMTEEVKQALDQISGTEQKDNRIASFFDLNCLAARGAYIRAYEQARQDLLFFANRSWDDNVALYKEALWQFIHFLVTQMAERMAHAESTFLGQKPDWKALGALRTLENDLVEWD
ncbi:MAG TPA: hypothetical protein PK360_00545 [bacterium]|nr:hypothetical protein [bacterium]